MFCQLHSRYYTGKQLKNHYMLEMAVIECNGMPLKKSSMLEVAAFDVQWHLTCTDTPLKNNSVLETAALDM